MSPRQKMIGMMYLVLTAMLALNVQREILDAFVMLDEGMDNTFQVSESQRNDVWSKLELAHGLDPVKTAGIYASAASIKEGSNALISKIDSLNALIISETEGMTIAEADTIHLKYVEKKEQYQEATQIMVGPNEQLDKGQASGLKQELLAYESLISEELQKHGLQFGGKGLNFEDQARDGVLMPWEKYTYYELPLAAIVAFHGKLKNDVKQQEMSALGSLVSAIAMEDFPIDTIVAKVIPNSNYIIRGQKYEASIFLGGYSTTNAPEVIMNMEGNPTSLPVEGGMGMYETTPQSIGLQTVEGEIKMTNNRGEVKSFPFASEYVVAPPSATVSPTAMNLLYQGVENPLAVSVPGVPDDKVRVTIGDGHQLTKTGQGTYKVNMNTGSTARTTTVRVAAEIGGEVVPMNTLEFRVKKLPAPKARIGRITNSGRMKRSDLSIQNVILEYDKGFPMDIPKPDLISYDVVISDGSGELKERRRLRNRNLNSIDDFLKAAKPGSTVYVENITIMGKDGERHVLSPLIITIIR